MYSRRNAYAESPGVWITSDGEYELTRKADERNAWYVRRRDSNQIIGIATGLTGAFAMAGRHYVTPVGQWGESK